MLDPRTFPRPPRLERIAKELIVKWHGSHEANGDVIASTRNAFWVLETFHPPTYYIPASDVKVHLKPSHQKTFCEWKGFATYFTIAGPDGRDILNRAWTYENPSSTYRDIKGYLSFYADDNWECYVDGERVEPQPGDFYGGWMTSDIVRSSVKGAPGTRSW